MSDDKGKPGEPGFMTLAWFKPLYRRVILIAVIAAWAAWEWLFNADQLWQILTLFMLGYGVWTFFISFDRELAKQDNGKPKN